MTRGRKLVAIGAAVGGSAALAALAWGWWLPSMVRERAQAAAEALGLQAQIAGASMRLGGVVLEGVELRGRHGGLTASVQEVGVAASLLGLATEGAAAIDAVEARRVRVQVDLASEGLGESLDALRAARVADPAADGGAPAAQERLLAVRDLELSVTDAAGSLVSLEGAALERRGGAWELESRRVVLGGAPHDLVEIDDLSARAEGGPSGPRLRALRAERVSATLARRTGEDDEEGSDPDALLTRARAARERLLPADPVAGDPAAAPEPEGGLLRHLAIGAEIEIASLGAVARTPRGTEPVVSELGLSVVRRDEARLAVRGRGQAGESGDVRIDLVLWPDALRGEGSVRFSDLSLAFVAPLLPSIPWHEPERARVDGDLVVRGDGADRIGLRGRVALRDAALASPRIAPEPVGGLSFEAEGEATWLPASRRLEIASAELSVGEAHLRLGGSVEWQPDRYAFELGATLPPMPCDEAIGAIPADLLAELRGFSFTGTLGARLRLSLDSRRLEDTELELSVSESCVFQTVPAAADLTRFQRPFVHRVREPDGTFFEMTSGPGAPSWTSIYSTSPFFVHAVLAHEDASFFRHAGFAPWAIRDALVRNLRERRFVYGGSTITMQLAKNLFLHREKYLARKVQEVLLTFWLEKALEKVELLELYLNVIEYGPGIYGIRAAAGHYFGRDPSQLSPAESAFLACILPAPKRMHGNYERGELSASMQGRMRRLLGHMAARGRIDQAALDHALREVDAFRFHRDPGLRLEPPFISGEARPLPFEVPGAVEPDLDSWEEAFDEPAAEDG